MIDVERDDKQFRRGVVLGLTMAEILLLLIFLLMLLMVARLQQERATAQAAQQATVQLADMREIIEDLQRRAGTKEFDITKEYRKLATDYVVATARLEKLEPIVRRLQEQGARSDFDIVEDFRRLQQLVENLKPGRPLLEEAKKNAPDASAEQAARHLIADANVGREMAEMAQQMMPSASSQEALEGLKARVALGDQLLKSGKYPNGLAESAAACQRQLQSCEGQTAHLNKRLNAQSGGHDKKPCWVDAEGNVQAIFDMKLQHEGIVVVDRKVSDRVPDEANLPLIGIQMGQPLTKVAFGVAVTPLFNWSQQEDCRFHVNLIDETGEGEKPLYKDFRKSVEAFFYLASTR